LTILEGREGGAHWANLEFERQTLLLTHLHRRIADENERDGGMSAENSHQTSLNQKAVREAKEITYVFLYLAAFFCALATYSMLLLEKFEISYFTYRAALLNTLIITKIILIEEAVHFAKKHEAKPLCYSCVYKAFVYGVLAFVLHIVEEVIKRLIHGKTWLGRPAKCASTTYSPAA
jgi:hypothetical protein